jgi:hypothetical protein
MTQTHIILSYEDLSLRLCDQGTRDDLIKLLNEGWKPEPGPFSLWDITDDGHIYKVNTYLGKIVIAPLPKGGNSLDVTSLID